MDGGEEVARGLVVAGGDGTELLEFGEEVLDEVTRLVDVLVVVARQSPVCLGGITAIFPAAASGAMTRSSASNALSAISVSACIEGRRWSAPTRSCASPPVRKKLTGLPSASTRAWILVLNPPRDRPIAWSSPAFFGRRRCADGHAQWCCRSSHIHCRRQRKVAGRPSPIHPIWPIC